MLAGILLQNALSHTRWLHAHEQGRAGLRLLTWDLRLPASVLPGAEGEYAPCQALCKPPATFVHTAPLIFQSKSGDHAQISKWGDVVSPLAEGPLHWSTGVMAGASASPRVLDRCLGGVGSFGCAGRG